MLRTTIICVMTFFVLEGSAQAQRFQERGARPLFLSPMTFGSGADAVRIGALRANRCSPEMGIRITAPREALFANNQRELQGLWPQILAHIQQNCPETQTLEIEGAGRGRSVYKGSARASSGWTLVHERAPLSSALEDADRQTIRFEDTRQLDSVMQRHSSAFGGTDTPDAAALMTRIEERKAKLVNEQFEQFSRELRSVPANLAGLDRLGTMSASLFRTLEARYAASLPRFRDARDSRAREIEVAVTNEVDRELNAPVAGWREVVARSALIRERQGALGKRIALINDIASDAVAKLDEALPQFLPEFRDFIARSGEGWDALARLNVENETLARGAGLVKGLAPYVDVVAERRIALLSGIEQRSAEEIAALGNSVGEIEAVIDRGEDIAKRLAAVGMADAATRIRQVVALRVNALADQGYETFAKSLDQLPATLESRAQLLAVAQEYAALETNVPAFSRYSDLAEERIVEIERKVCSAAATAIGDETLLAQSVSLKQGLQTLKDYTCQVALAGHKISQKKTMWSRLIGVFSSDVTLEFVSASGDATEITLRPANVASGGRMLAGHSAKSAEGDIRPLSESEWHALTVRMITPPASGKPDQTGRTECDRLAADPDDPKKRAPGVKDDQLDVKSALEACIAAVEHRPSDAVQLYQLGRLLKHGGNEELAQHYLETAAKAGSPAAAAKLADLQALHEDQVKLALQNYKSAVRGGYEPAKQQLAMLSIGEPIDFAKDPPTSGTFKLLCLIENTSYTVGGDVHDVWISELTGEFDLDRNEARFDYDKIATSNDRKLIERGSSYRVSASANAWSVPVAAIGGDTGSHFLWIGKRDLMVSHRQPMILGSLFGIPVKASLSVSGECMQSF